ncbi:MAG: DsrE family protein [Cytophagaceae bacterium]|nr:DsrE family protein [Cytophagaceae bacterium]MBK9511707.1 DsrE family protein [Cytophagaceae bacterium]MBK9934270.1 DsrE family protein [Cytophagaceae bacterium]MBL0300722.1 DsrE family protein [Cytophagaceae bacterium]MBL0327664.1 DsrE family protein [Cytophagaceae bacterium]
MKILFIINDAPYGSEKAYNALRIANQLGKEHPDTEVRIFLMADAVSAALPNQNTPNGFYNIERMLKLSLNKGAKVKLCGSCTDARGIRNLPLVEGAEISTLAELTDWVVDSDKVLTF